jgi:hypothetical protein
MVDKNLGMDEKNDDNQVKILQYSTFIEANVNLTL